MEKVEFVELEGGVIPLWKKYGFDIEKPTFGVAYITKTSNDLKEAIDLYEQMFYTSLEQLMRIPGNKENKSMIEEVLEEMKKAKRFKPGKSFQIQPGDVESFDVGGHPPEPDWAPV